VALARPSTRPSSSGRPLTVSPSLAIQPRVFGVIQLNGADNVTINGDNPNTSGTNRNLTIVNTVANTTAFSSVVRVALSTLIASGNNNSVRNWHHHW
jgi:hypothetical protein